ncbi:hypothetical protein [Burkholderia sp. NLJ2]|uniref:hypothetical protein n=1 Tax=Burkholderia sp. NLJ2 TaxID=3090699 RepID=UPI003C6C9EA9
MNTFSEIDYQKQLVVSGLDDFSPNGALSQVLGGQFGSTPELWRKAVIDFLCINVRVGMLECVHRKEISGESGAILLRELLDFGDRENNFDVEVIWNVLYFSATPELVAVLRKFNLNDWGSIGAGINRQFMEYLNGVYSTV